MDPRGALFRVTDAASKARFGQSKLPQQASKTHHFANNLASHPTTRLLHVGKDVSYVLWGNEHAKVHWIDEDFELSPSRPDVHPYNLVVVDPLHVRPNVLLHHADKLAPEVVVLIPGWASSNVRARVRREVARLHRWDFTARLEITDPEWDMFAGVMSRGG